MDRMSSATGLSESERHRLGRLADVLIPGGCGMPSATAAGVSLDGIDRLLAVRDDLREPLARILLNASDNDPESDVQHLRSSDSVSFAVLSFCVAGAYFLDSAAMNSVGYPGLVANPSPRGQLWPFADEDLLEPVWERGSIVRAAP